MVYVRSRSRRDYTDNSWQLSDTLLSILAVRGGELVESIFSGKGEGMQLRLKL